MSIKRAVAVTVVAAAAVGIFSCGGSKTAAVSGGSSSPSSAKAQAAPEGYGTELKQEKCIEKANEFGSPMRESGNGSADDIGFATNLALLDARAKLAQQLEVLVDGAIKNFDEKYAEKSGAASSVKKAQQYQEAYFERFLNNTRPICQSNYQKANGDYNIFVAIELDDGTLSQIYKSISADREDDIDFKEHIFKEEIQEQRARFLEGKKR